MKGALERIGALFSGGDRVFVIAEAGCNYEGDFARAEEMVRAAAEAGADAIKFQTFVPERLVTRDAPKFWDIEGCPGATQFEEFVETPQLGEGQYRALKRTADREGILLFSTPSDEQSADMLDGIGVPLYKISSMDITHLPLIRHVAGKGKPVILSTGASTMEEIRDAVRAIEGEGNDRIALLHCITSYPTRPEDVNLGMMASIMDEFPGYPVGYSDHTVMPESLPVLVSAVALGARIIEKHFTFDRTRPGFDHLISADYRDLGEIVRQIALTRRVLGSRVKAPVRAEERARTWARRSLVARTLIPRGTRITEEMVLVKRPGTGIPPGCLPDLVGKVAAVDISEDQVITWEMVVR
jgi:N-acetylneuraminate synthase